MKQKKWMAGNTDILELLELDITIRAYNALKITRLDTIETLLCLRENIGDKAFRKMLLQIPALGKSSADTICTALDKYIEKTGRRPQI